MDSRPVAVVIGATGTVGQGVIRSLRAGGWSIVAVGRSEERLLHLAAGDPAIFVVAGSVAGDREAKELAARVRAAVPRIDAVIATVNIPNNFRPLLEFSAEDLMEVIQGNLIVHHSAARAFIPMLRTGGRYIGIGGGMADFIVAGAGAVSICQAAQRNMFRFLALEAQAQDVSVVELMLCSHIVAPEDEGEASEKDIRADEVGEHVRAVLEQPELFAGPILMLKSRKQVGLPERQ